MMGIITFGYGVAFFAYVVHFIRHRSETCRAGSLLLFATLLLHSVWLVIERVQTGHLPIADAYHGLSFVGWGIALTYVVIELRLGHQPGFGPFVTPVIFLFQAAATLFLLFRPQTGPLPDILQSIWFEIHAGTALFSYCAFAIAFAAGLMHILLWNELRLKKLGFFFSRMPPLEVLERINYHTVALGFLFLTLGIASGIIWLLRVRATDLLIDSKEISAVIVWLLYAANLHARRHMGWRGQRTAVFSVVNFALLFAVFCLTSLVLSAHKF